MTRRRGFSAVGSSLSEVFLTFLFFLLALRVALAGADEQFLRAGQGIIRDFRPMGEPLFHPVAVP